MMINGIYSICMTVELFYINLQLLISYIWMYVCVCVYHLGHWWCPAVTCLRLICSSVSLRIQSKHRVYDSENRNVNLLQIQQVFRLILTKAPDRADLIHIQIQPLPASSRPPSSHEESPLLFKPYPSQLIHRPQRWYDYQSLCYSETIIIFK